ncbi:MAG: hypothetical protein NTY38_03495, partial [Acidobacteria bacterium]|nr:hypothetical protein [Acidobacteriota bacterium]
MVEGPVPEGSTLEWIFTGDEGGFSVILTPGRARLVQRYYDSFGLASARPPASRMPEKVWEESAIDYPGSLESVKVTLDHRMGLLLSLNGRDVARQRCVLEVRRHQVAWTPA